LEEALVLEEVKNLRSQHKVMGTRKLYLLLSDFLQTHGIKMGRDALFDLLADNHLLIRKRKRKCVTTNSKHWMQKYPNLIKGFVPTGINQLWVSDITYWRIGDQFVYLSFITDMYSRKIVGYHVGKTLESIESVKALEKALQTLSGSTPSLMHHSDRGTQYCSSMYVSQLQNYEIKISMTETGDPRDNAVAERVNGIIKAEYLDHYKVKTFKEAQKMLDIAVNLYNNERPHLSIGNLTPNAVHHATEPLKLTQLWKNYYKNNPEVSASV